MWEDGSSKPWAEFEESSLGWGERRKHCHSYPTERETSIVSKHSNRATVLEGVLGTHGKKIKHILMQKSWWGFSFSLEEEGLVQGAKRRRRREFPRRLFRNWGKGSKNFALPPLFFSSPPPLPLPQHPLLGSSSSQRVNRACGG